MALVGQISWDSLFSDVGRMSVVTKSGVTYAADALRDTNTRFSFFTGL